MPKTKMQQTNTRTFIKTLVPWFAPHKVATVATSSSAQQVSENQKHIPKAGQSSSKPLFRCVQSQIVAR